MLINPTKIIDLIYQWAIINYYTILLINISNVKYRYKFKNTYLETVSCKINYSGLVIDDKRY